MKKVAFLFLFLPFLMAFENPHKPDKRFIYDFYGEVSRLKGKVKQIKYLYEKVLNKQVETELKDILSKQINIFSFSHSKDSSFSYFDSSGHLLESTSSDGMRKLVFRYSLTGDILEKKFYYNSIFKGASIYEYDPNNRWIKEKLIDSLGNVASWTDIEYGKSSSVLTESHYNKDRKLSYSVYKYSENAVEVNSYFPNGKILHYRKETIKNGKTCTLTKSYNEDGFMWGKDEINKSSNSSYEKFTNYDKGGQYILYEVNDQYNENGHLVKEITNRANERTVRTYHYDYDDKGNYIKQAYYINNIPVALITRIIEYY